MSLLPAIGPAMPTDVMTRGDGIRPGIIHITGIPGIGTPGTGIPGTTTIGIPGTADGVATMAGIIIPGITAGVGEASSFPRAITRAQRTMAV